MAEERMAKVQAKLDEMQVRGCVWLCCVYVYDCGSAGQAGQTAGLCVCGCAVCICMTVEV
jgi:hypothetical protein